MISIALVGLGVESAMEVLIGSFSRRSSLSRREELLSLYRTLAAAAHAKNDLRSVDRTLRFIVLSQFGEASINAELSLDLARTYIEQGRFEEAEVFYEKAIKAGELTNNPDLLAVALVNQGWAYQSSGVPAEAKKRYLRAMTIMGRRTVIDATAFANLATIALENAQLDAARDYLRQAIQLEQGLGQRRELAEDYCRLALIFNMQGEKELAQQIAMKAVEIFGETGARRPDLILTSGDE